MALALNRAGGYFRRTMIWIVLCLQGNTSTIQELSSTDPAKFVSKDESTADELWGPKVHPQLGVLRS